MTRLMKQLFSTIQINNMGILHNIIPEINKCVVARKPIAEVFH